MKNILFSKRVSQKDFQGEFVDVMLKAAAGAKDVISFSGGLPNPISFPIEEIKKATNKVLEKQGTTALQYSETEGYYPLRQYIANRYIRQGVDVKAEDIIITNGSQQGLAMMAGVLLDKGDIILVEKPSYLAALQVFHLYQPKVESLSLKSDGVSLKELEEGLKKQPKFMYSVPTFQNPTGLSYSEEKRSEVAKCIKETNTIFIEDNPYGELRFSGTPKTSMKTYLGDQCVAFGTFSKIVSPGMRIGWICCTHPQLRKKLVSYKQMVDLHTNVFGQMIVYQYLQDNALENHIRKITELYHRQVTKMMESMDIYFPKEVKYTRPEGGMFLWVTLPKGITALELAKEALIKGVAIAPGDPFYESERNVQTLRLNYTNCNEEMIEKGIQILGNIIKKKLVIE